MSTKNNKSVASQALLDMDAITSAIKEESKKTLNGLLSEAVRNALREGCKEEDEKEDYEVIDGEKKGADDKKKDSEKSEGSVSEDNEQELENGAEPTPEMGSDAQEAQPAAEDPAAAEAPIDGEGAAAEAGAEDGGSEEGWEDFSKYQVGDDTYDLTGEKDYDNVVKVYKLLKDDDQVVVKKEGNTVQLQDGAAGTEYVIDLGDDAEESPVEAKSEEMAAPEQGLNEDESGIAGFGDVEGESDFDVPSQSDDNLKAKLDDIQAQIDALRANAGEENNLFENKKSRKPMKESKEVLFEVDLGYTDNYQDKDPIAGLSNNEPSKSGKSWHKGVPTGTSKPWAGETKSKGEPFEKTVEEEVMPEVPEAGAGDAELEEGAKTVSSQSVAKTTHTPTSEPRAEYARKVAKLVHANGEYKKLQSENKALKQRVKALTEAVLAIRENLSEAYVTNANLGKITKLFLENTTSQDEKINIVNRFANEAKTIEQSNALYESIDKDLKKVTPTININESKSAKGNQELNENKVYKSEDLLKTIDFMNRMLNC